MSMERIRQSRGVPAKRGMRVFYGYTGQMGTIRSAKRGYLMIQLDGDKWPQPYHPSWKLDYLAKDGSVLFSGDQRHKPPA